MGSAEPPSYRLAQAQESYPSKEKSTGAQEIEITGMAKDSRAGTPLPQLPTRAPTGLAWTNEPANRSAAQGDAVPNVRQSGLRSAAEEERSRPGFAIRRGTPPPPEPAHPPRYRPRELSPALPPYRATEGSSAPPLKVPWPQDRSRKPSSAFSGGEPRLALPSGHPPLPDSSVSRIRAAYRVSNELGNAVMLQEVRVTTPADYPRPDAASAVTRRFVSVTEPEGFRKVDARVDRRSSEREARQRASSKPSDCGGRSHDGKIYRTASERLNPVSAMSRR